MSKNGKNRAFQPGRPEAVADPAKRETLKKLGTLGLLALVDIGALASCGRKVISASAKERKVIVLGIDGIDPRIVEGLMAQGKLPNMKRLQEMGTYRRMTGTIPPQSPVAWATVCTGQDPSGHEIYDFIERDPKTYFPYFSIARSEGASKSLAVGKWNIPLSQGKMELLRKGRTLWDHLTEAGIPADVYRVPSNFPPNDTGARQLTGLGAPDIRGSYGEFSYYTEAPVKNAKDISGGEVLKVAAREGLIKTRIRGPKNSLQKGEPDTYADFEIWLDRGHKLAKISLQGQEMLLKQGEWSEWLSVNFEMVPHVKSVSGICRFYLKEVAPHLKLYATPVNIDPKNPEVPITAPMDFAGELAKKFGRFYTQGFPHDVKALRHGIFSDDEYLQQSGIAYSEECRMWEAALNEFHRGLLFYYFATSDRTQHMFWRTMDPRHPAYDPKEARANGSAIEDCYRDSDKLVGQALEALDGQTTLIVMSDHGFSPYYRSFNLNSWLAENGYLAGADIQQSEADIFSGADWGRTAAYGLGFNAVYINLQGREPQGSVDPNDRANLIQQIAEGLEQVLDPKTGERIIVKAYPGDSVYAHPDLQKTPDLVVGYAPGYRCSDESVLGTLTKNIVEDNRDKWSGDHCIDYQHVPAMLLANKPVQNEAPALENIAASVLAEFGIKKPADMTGESIW